MNRKEVAATLIRWRDESRRHAAREIAQTRHEEIVRTAARKHLFVPAENLLRYGLDRDGHLEPTILGMPLSRALQTAPEAISAEGLHDIEEDDDMLAALARELVAENGVGQTADAIWSELKSVYDRMPTATHPLPADEEDPSIFVCTDTDGDFVEPPLLQPEQRNSMLTTTVAATSPITLFGQPLPSAKRKGKRRGTDFSQQPSLFNWN